MARASIDDLIEARRRESTDGGDRFVDMRVDFVDEASGEVWLTCGGRWDRREKNYNGKPKKRVVVRCHPGQRRAIEWFGKWLASHRKRRGNPPPLPASFDVSNLGSVDIEELIENLDVEPHEAYAALFAGGRRAGKTWIGVAIAIAYAVEFSDAIVWLIAPVEGDWPELVRYARGVIANEWKYGETADGWVLVNGSVIQLKSAHDPEGLKKGRVDFAVLNEGQKVKLRAYTVVRAAVADVGGCVLVCANPPNEAKDQVWVSDFAADAAVGKRAAVYVEFNALLNPHIDRRALLSMAGENDKRTFEIEVLGMFRGPKDAVAYNWIRTENEKERPLVGNVTEAFLSAMEEGDGIKRVIGIDVQTFPYMAACCYEFFGSTDPSKVIAWITDEIALEGGDEVSLADAMFEKGWLPDETLLVVDASGQYQHSRRRAADAPPPEWRGRGSFDIFRMPNGDRPGYWRIVAPDRKMKKNPDIVDRMRAFTSMICTSTGVRRLFADPKLAAYTCKAIREWKVVNGKPQRAAEVAHMGDGASYPIARLFPRRLRSGKPGAVDPVASKVDKQPIGARELARGRAAAAGPVGRPRARGRWKGL